MTTTEAPQTQPRSTAPVLIFDVLGSLLDEDAGQLRAVRDEPALQTAAAGGFVERWSTRFHQLAASVSDGQDRYQVPEVLYARAARDVAATAQLSVTEEVVMRLARFGRSLDPFPEVPHALDALSQRFALVALTNAGTSQALAMSHHAGLRWSTLLSGETVQAYKPDPRMYRYAVAALDLQPERCTFVAAHQWDLDAAARHGFRTAYLNRAGDGDRARADVQAEDLDALAPLLD